MSRSQQLLEIRDTCRSLGVDARYDPEHNHLTALAWEDEGEDHALFIQDLIIRQAARHPGLICYCFDTFSTLVYAV